MLIFLFCLKSELLQKAIITFIFINMNLKENKLEKFFDQIESKLGDTITHYRLDKLGGTYSIPIERLI